MNEKQTRTTTVFTTNGTLPSKSRVSNDCTDRAHRMQTTREII
jgi:hypothetical protein